MHINAAGRRISVEVEKDATLQQLKMKVMDEMGIPPQHQKMSFKGKLLKDNEAILSSLGIDSTSELDLIPTMRGGCGCDCCGGTGCGCKCCIIQ